MMTQDKHIPINHEVKLVHHLEVSWYSLEQCIGCIVDKLSTTAVVFFKSEGKLKCKCLYGV